MRENRCERIVEKLRAASQAREKGESCPNALMESYREELGENYSAAVELAGKLPGLLAEPDLCDVFAVTFAIIVQLTGVKDGYVETIA